MAFVPDTPFKLLPSGSVSAYLPPFIVQGSNDNASTIANQQAGGRYKRKRTRMTPRRPSKKRKAKK